ncbi:MAG: potassium transporter Kup [Stenotrophobium sp.]
MATTENRESSSLALSLAALGVVFGDIGTSPIYAFRQCFIGTGHPLEPVPANVFGILSLIIWSLLLVISLKYLVVVMRADNKGEGGVAALVALLNPWRAKRGSLRYCLMLLGLFGAALLFGDATITPAISVLSAIEGLDVATPALQPYIIPITLLILVVLFLVQKRGTGSLGMVFGPVLLLWFAAIAVLGVRGIIGHPQVLAALNPYYAVLFFAHNGGIGFLALGAVFLAVTGGEALYADMGHFGPSPIRRVWFWLVLPALLLNYLGQGALILGAPQKMSDPFYHLVPGWAIYPMVILAGLATVVASQAVISGTFSLTRQLVQLGQWPRVNIIQTSAEERGQIYIPFINWLMLLATLGLVVGFKSSDALASAYGIAVATTMVITTILSFFVARRFDWNPWLARALVALFLVPDVAFFSANLIKIEDGGWYPILVALLAFTVTTTWGRGRFLMMQAWGKGAQALSKLALVLQGDPPFRIPGTAVFFTQADTAPPYVLRHLHCHRILQADAVFLTVSAHDVPRIATLERLQVYSIARGITRVIVSYGYMQTPNIPVALKLCETLGLNLDLEHATYYVGRQNVIADPDIEGMWLWRERLFAFLQLNALPATTFYQLPPGDVVELGFQVSI